MLLCFIFHTGASVSCNALGHRPQCGDASPASIKTVPFPQQDTATAASMGCWWCLSLTERGNTSAGACSYPSPPRSPWQCHSGSVVCLRKLMPTTSEIFERSGNQSCKTLVVQAERESTNLHDHKEQPCTGAAVRVIASWSWACNTPGATGESGSVFVPWMLQCW